MKENIGALDRLIDRIIDFLNVSETDAVIAVICGSAGLTIDFYLFSGGMPPGMVTSLSAVSGFVGSKLFKRTPLFRKMMLKRLKSIKGQISEERYNRVKEELLLEWVTPGSSKPEKPGKLKE